LPENVVINVEGREAGENVLASDIQLPQGVTLLTDAETVIATVSVPVEVDLGEEAAEGEEAEAEAPAEEAKEESAE
jgi:large subunit ribosomal protein L25